MPSPADAPALDRGTVAVVLSLLGAREGQRVLDLSPSAGLGPAAGAAVGSHGGVVLDPVPDASVQRAVLCATGAPSAAQLSTLARALAPGGGAVVLWPAGLATAVPPGSGLRVRLEVPLDDAARAVALVRT